MRFTIILIALASLALVGTSLNAQDAGKARKPRADRAVPERGKDADRLRQRIEKLRNELRRERRGERAEPRGNNAERPRKRMRDGKRMQKFPNRGMQRGKRGGMMPGKHMRKGKRAGLRPGKRMLERQRRMHMRRARR